MSVVLIGFLAFAIDVGYLYQQKRMAQAAADAAAVVYAEEENLNADGRAKAAAKTAAIANGMSSSVTVTPASSGSGNYSSAATSVPTTWYSVTVSQPVNTYFLGAFMPGMKSINVSAVGYAAAGQAASTCVCLEGSTGEDLNMSNNSKLTASNCGVTVDSSGSNAVGIVGGSQLCAQTLGSVSTTWNNGSNYNNNVNNGGSICSSTSIVTGSSFSCSTKLPTAPSYSNCVNDPTGGAWGTYTLGPSQASGTVCYNSLVVGSNGATVTLNPGIYVINGGSLHFESGANGHSNLGGNGVFFYLVNNASLTIDNGANVNLVAGGNTMNGGGTAGSPGSGQYNGILFYQDSADTQNMSIQGGSSAYFNGQIVAPAAAVTLGNGSGTSVTAGITAKTLTMNGGGTLNSSSGSNQGTQNTSTAKLVQ